MSDSWPDATELSTLFQGVCDRDPLALNDFAAAVLDPLTNHLRYRHREADEHACISAAGEAVLELLRNPAIFDPAQRGLIGFLCMSAECDLLNALQREARHHCGRESSECVELAPDKRNPLPDALADYPHLVAEIATFTALERAVLDLILAGEHKTAAFVPLLDISHLSEDEQAREVKRVKDRIIKRLQRAGGKP